MNLHCLTYKLRGVVITSAGSRFWQSGSFEVTKNTILPSEHPDTGAGSQGVLQVVIPSELEGTSYVQVKVKSVPGRDNH